MAVILDYRGKPVDFDDVREEQATISLAGVRSQWFESVASFLTPERLGSILKQVDEGLDLTSYLTLAEEMEERDLHYFSVLSTRKLAVSGLQIQIESYSDNPEDVAIAEATRDLVGSEDVDNLVQDLMDALGKGFSVSEIMWDVSMRQWFPKEYRWRDPRFFTFDQREGRELRLLDDENPAYGVPLKPFKFIQHRPRLKTGLPIRSGLARLACVAFMCKSYSLKDWMAFAETYGMPLRLGRYGPDATKEDRARLLRAVSMLGTDAAAIIPEGMEVEFVQNPAGTGGAQLFGGLADYLDKQVSKGVLGQTATTEGTPGKLGADNAQENVREDLRISDAKQLAATLRRDLVKPFVDLNFGPRQRGRYPLVKLVAEQAEDVDKLLTRLPPLISLGLRVQESVIRDKLGLPEPEEGALLLQAAPQGLPGMPPPGMFRQQLDTAAQKTPAVKADAVEPVVEDVLEDWEGVVGSMLDPIIELASNAKSEKDFLRRLEKLQLDTDTLAEAVAVATFKARALGDEKVGKAVAGVTRSGQRYWSIR